MRLTFRRGRPAAARARRRARAAGWALGWGLLGFVCLQLALAVPMEWGRPGLRDPAYGAKRDRLRARLAEGPGRPLLVVLGSSRAVLGFRPAALPPLPAARPPRGGAAAPPLVFNAAAMGAGPVQQLLGLRRLLADGRRPDWVLLECWPPLLMQERQRAELRRVAPARLGWGDLGVLAPYSPDPRGLYEGWCLARLVPWWSSRFALLERFAGDWLPRATRHDDEWKDCDAWGWLPYDGPSGPAAVRRRRAAARRKFQPVLGQFRVSEAPDRALREALALCRREGIAAGLLYLPESPAFRGWYPPAARAEADAYLGRLSREWGVPLLDARDWGPEADFADGFHLLPPGADRFTERFGRELLPGFLGGRLAPPPSARAAPAPCTGDGRAGIMGAHGERP